MTLLAFFRYAACPMCNLRVHELNLRYRELSDRGLSILAVFHSPPESIRRYVGKQDVPFPIISDPGLRLFRMYGVERSWAGFVSGLLRPEGYRAAAKGYLPGIPDVQLNTLPADFLINPDLTIHRAFYASTISEHLPIEVVEGWVG
jgi:alkyl hydroperoxide reductase subunit AhpC